MRRKIMRNKAVLMRIIAIIFLILLFNNARSDIYMKQKQHTDAMQMMGQSQPAQDLIVESWITTGKIVTLSTKQKIVIDIDKKIITIADHEKKTLSSMPLDFTKMVPQIDKDISSKEQADIQKLMGKMMQIKVTVKATNESKKIGNWNCRKYNQTMEMAMGTMQSEIWATSDIQIDKALYAKFSAGMMASIPGVSQNMDAVMQELEKINGVQVYTKQTTQMMGQSFNSTTELLEYKEGKAPANVFNLPASYKKTELFK